jgi:spectinomycin phosphotransferase
LDLVETGQQDIQRTAQLKPENTKSMLEKPDLQDEIIIACVQDHYGLHVNQVTFLPLGADQNTAVYRLITDEETPYFLKLRQGGFDETSVALPKFLSAQGITQIIAPLSTQTGQLYATLDAFNTILYPFIEGHNGYEVDLSDHQWVEFGMALQRVHAARVPEVLIERVQREAYSPKWREIVKMFLEHVRQDSFVEPLAIKSAVFIRYKYDEVFDLIKRAERLALALVERHPEFVLCHSDLHAGNILIAASGALYIVDWDNPILAPKERDLMFAGGGQFGTRRTPQQEETLFYQGYGQTDIDPIALAYYRYERIIEDIAVECEQIFLTTAGGDDREQAYQYLTSNFLPDGVIEIARKSDKTLRE